MPTSVGKLQMPSVPRGSRWPSFLLVALGVLPFFSGKSASLLPALAIQQEVGSWGEEMEGTQRKTCGAGGVERSWSLESGTTRYASGFCNSPAM